MIISIEQAPKIDLGPYFYLFMERVIDENIVVFQSAFWQLNSTCALDSGTTFVWDPAYTPTEMEAIYRRSNRDQGAHRYLIYTHGDFDHIVAGTLFDQFIRVGSQEMEAKKNKTASCNQIAAVDQEFYISRPDPVQFPRLELKIKADLPFKIRLGDTDVCFFKAGGHTIDGIFTVIPALGLWVAGDYLSDIEFPFIEDDIQAYFNTLDTAKAILKEFEIKTMVPGHGSIAKDRADILARINQSFQYLESLLTKKDIKDWRESWGYSPFGAFLDKMHLKNIEHVRAQHV